MRSYFKEKQRLRSRKLRLTTVGDPLHDTHLSTKVGTKFRRQVEVAQSVQFACGLRATELVCAQRLVSRVVLSFTVSDP
jgi:hypothetical protein